MKLADLSTLAVGVVTSALVALSAQPEPSASPVVFSSDPRITINRVTATGSVIAVEFIDSGTDAASYRLEWLPQLGEGAAWTDLREAQATPSADGSFQFNVSVQDLPVAFFRVRGLLAPSRDSDSDGMDDDWERRIFGSLDALASGDSDRDGYTNLQEHRAGTDPKQSASQPPFPLVTFAQADLEATEGADDVSLNLALNKSWSGQLHFTVSGSSVSGSDFDLPRSVGVAGNTANLRLRVRDNRKLDAIRWLRVGLVETAAYSAGRNGAVTVTLKDNDAAWQGAFVSRLGRVHFGLVLYNDGTNHLGTLVSSGGALPASPSGGFPLLSLTRSSEAPHLGFESGWLPLTPPPGEHAGMLFPGATHVRLTGTLSRQHAGLLSGNGLLEIGDGGPGGPLVRVSSQSLDLARTPASFVAGGTTFVP